MTGLVLYLAASSVEAHYLAKEVAAAQRARELFAPGLGLVKEVSELERMAATREAQIGRSGERPEFGAALERVWSTLPPKVMVAEVTMSPTGVSVKGLAGSLSAAGRFAEELSRQPELGLVRLKSVEGLEKPVDGGFLYRFEIVGQTRKRAVR